MMKPKKIASALIALIAWTLLGTLLGAAGGYVVYVRQPAVFQAEGALQIATVSPIAGTATGEEVDAGKLISSTAVLSKAASQGRLGRLPGMTGRNPQDVAEAIQTSGDLQVIAEDPDALGTVFRVQFRGATPSASQQIVQSVMQATVESLTEVDNTANWNESIQILTDVRQQIDQTVADLRRNIAQLPASSDVATVEEELVSVVSEKYQRLRADADQLQNLKNALNQKLRHVESMIQNGASTSAILAGLDIPVMPAVTQRQPASGGQAATNEQDAEQQRQLAERMKVEREIQSAMRPLQQELDKLLEKFGAQHPTVAFKQKQIDELQAKLDQLPPLNAALGSPRAPTDVASPSSDDVAIELQQDQGSDAAQKVMASLRALRSEKQQVEQAFEELASQLEQAAAEYAEQQNSQAERVRLNRELESQNQLLEQAATRLQELSSRPPFPKVRAAVLRAPGLGVQVEPQLKPLLVRGIQIGAVVGLVLVSLLYLTSLATSES
jgi:hypothetical protein